MNINKHKFKILLEFNSLLLFLSGCSQNNNDNNSIITTQLTSFAKGLSELFLKQEVVFALMFIAILFGSFALYKGLLRFAFKNTHNFKNKEINVISFMISIISSTGLFFIFNQSPKLFIVLFGGSAGLLLVSFIIIFIMFFFYHTAESVKNEDGIMKKGPGWFFIIAIGLILSSYLLIGYSGKVLTELGCNVNLETLIDKPTTPNCQLGEGQGFYSSLINIGSNILSFAIFGAFVFGIWWMFFKKKEDAEEEEESKDIGTLGKFFGTEKKRSEEEESEIKKVQEMLKDMVKGIEKVNKAFNRKQEILKELNKNLTAAKTAEESKSSEEKK